MIKNEIMIEENVIKNFIYYNYRIYVTRANFLIFHLLVMANSGVTLLAIHTRLYWIIFILQSERIYGKVYRYRISFPNEKSTDFISLTRQWWSKLTCMLGI